MFLNAVRADAPDDGSALTPADFGGTVWAAVGAQREAIASILLDGQTAGLSGVLTAQMVNAIAETLRESETHDPLADDDGLLDWLYGRVGMRVLVVVD